MCVCNKEHTYQVFVCVATVCVVCFNRVMTTLSYVTPTLNNMLTYAEDSDMFLTTPGKTDLWLELVERLVRVEVSI